MNTLSDPTKTWLTTQRAPLGSEGGDTLLEVLVTLVIISISVVALLLAFSTSISASAEHRSLVSIDTVLTSASEQAVSELQQQPNPLFSSCATASTYTDLSFNLPTGYGATISTVEYWTGNSFGSTCTAGSTAPQLIGLSVSGPMGATSSISFAVQDPNYSTSATAASLVSITPGPQPQSQAESSPSFEVVAKVRV